MPGLTENPVFMREFNKRMRERNAFLVPTLYVLTLILVFGSSYLDMSGGDTQPWQLGQAMFESLSKLAVILVGLLVPVFSAGSITIEKEQKTLTSLLMSMLAPVSIVVGKLAASVGYVLLVVSTSIPIILLAFLFGGVSLTSFLLHYLSLATVAVFLGSLGLLISASFKRSMYAIAFNYGLLALSATLALFAMSYLRGIEYSLKVPILPYVAFLNPLFFLEAGTRHHWLMFVLFYLCFATLLSYKATNRVRNAEPI